MIRSVSSKTFLSLDFFFSQTFPGTSGGCSRARLWGTQQWNKAIHNMARKRPINRISGLDVAINIWNMSLTTKSGMQIWKAFGHCTTLGVSQVNKVGGTLQTDDRILGLGYASAANSTFCSSMRTWFQTLVISKKPDVIAGMQAWSPSVVAARDQRLTGACWPPSEL